MLRPKINRPNLKNRLVLVKNGKQIPRKTEINPIFKKIKRDKPYEEVNFPENKSEFIRNGKLGVFWESLIKLYRHTSFQPGQYILNLTLNLENGENVVFERIPFNIRNR